MQWKLLLDHKCPSCGGFLVGGALGVYNCPGECGFKIKDTKLRDLKDKMELDALERAREGWER